MTCAPSFADAVVLPAALNLQPGTARPAIEDLERFLASHPKAAPSLVGQAYLATCEPARATKMCRRLPALTWQPSPTSGRAGTRPGPPP